MEEKKKKIRHIIILLLWLLLWKDRRWIFTGISEWTCSGITRLAFYAGPGIP
jgi:hypothetical protein